LLENAHRGALSPARTDPDRGAAAGVWVKLGNLGVARALSMKIADGRARPRRPAYDRA
jgi:hypothetical protein